MGIVDKYTESQEEVVITKIFQWSKAICLFFALFFFLSQILDAKLFIGTDAIGQYGDFVGGVIGTILSVILLYFTFNSQIEESKNNAKVFTLQQFNDTFFHLFDQYNFLVNNFYLTYNEESGEERILKGKEAMHYCLEIMRKSFGDENVNNGRKVAVGYFTNYLASHVGFVPIYYRVLYRIFDLIEFSGISESDKVRYAKIVRSQFTDTELVLMRYNAMTQVGKNMVSYINEFNLLKHLPPLEMLEYAKWRNLFTIENRNKANIILVSIKKNFHDLYCGESNTLAYTSLKAKYNINMSRTDGNVSFKLDFHRRLNIATSPSDVFCCFDAVVIKDIVDLFYDWMFEIFVVSNFQKYNGFIEIDKNVTPLQDHKEHFSLTVTKKDGTALKLDCNKNK